VTEPTTPTGKRLADEHIAGMRTIGIAGVTAIKSEVCVVCLDPWPCDAAIALALADQLADHILKHHVQRDQACWGCDKALAAYEEARR